MKTFSYAIILVCLIIGSLESPMNVIHNTQDVKCLSGALIDKKFIENAAMKGCNQVAKTNKCNFQKCHQMTRKLIPPAYLGDEFPGQTDLRYIRVKPLKSSIHEEYRIVFKFNIQKNLCQPIGVLLQSDRQRLPKKCFETSNPSLLAPVHIGATHRGV